MIPVIHTLAEASSQNVLGGYEGLILAVLNVVQLAMSSWNNRKLSRVQVTQANGSHTLNGKGGK